MKRNKGFTLIELLVVIAIIGILSAIVLASLNSARNKANDAKVQGQLSSLRAAAEIAYSTSAGYGLGDAAGDCASLKASIGALANDSSYPDSHAPTFLCDGSATSNITVWAASHPLTSGATADWCVDSTGASIGTSAAVTTTKC